MAKKKGTDVADGTAMTTTGPTSLSTEVYDLEGVDDGFGNQDQSFTTVPYIEVLQPMSPMVTSGDAKAGNLYIKATSELIDGDEGILFTPSICVREFVEWKPRNDGGGVVARHPAHSELAQRIQATQRVGKFALDNGNEVIETFYLWGARLDANLQPTSEMVVIPCTSTKIKPLKTLMGQLRGQLVDTPAGKRRLPLFANVVRMTTAQDKKDKFVFYKPVFTPAGGSLKASRVAQNHPAFMAAQELHGLVTSGLAQVATEVMDAGPVADEDVPF